MAQSRIDLATNEEFITAYEQNSYYTNMARSLGYGQNINNNVRLKIKERLEQLGLLLYEGKMDIGLVTKEELFKNRANYQSARSSIWRHTQKVFENSSKDKCCKICGHTKHYEVAHIKAVADFDDNILVNEINSEDNLIALCPNHHWEYDNGLLNIDAG